MEGIPRGQVEEIGVNPKELGLEDGIEFVTAFIEKQLREKQTPVVVAIAGGSASGKSSAVSGKITEQIELRTGTVPLVISMDDYYKGLTFMQDQMEQGNPLNFDQPDVIDMELLAEHLSALIRGESIKKPIYSMKSGQREGYEITHPSQVIIVDGLFTLSDQFKGLYDLGVFVRAREHSRFIRRLLRDTLRTSMSPRQIIDYFLSTVSPAHDLYVEPTHSNAHIIITNEYDPVVEAGRAPNIENQIKFRADNVSKKSLESIGSIRIETVHQTDSYFAVPIGNTGKTSPESLRIREELDEAGNHIRIILGYKGPRKPTTRSRVKPILSEEISRKTERSLRSKYRELGVVRKERERWTWQHDITFCVDRVVQVTQRGITRNIGDFIEVDMSQIPSERGVQILLDSLGISRQDRILRPYIRL